MNAVNQATQILFPELFVPDCNGWNWVDCIDCKCKTCRELDESSTKFFKEEERLRKIARKSYEMNKSGS